MTETEKERCGNCGSGLGYAMSNGHPRCLTCKVAYSYKSTLNRTAELLVENAALKARVAELEAMQLWDTGANQPLPEDDQIMQAHSIKDGDGRIYAEAQRMVSAKYSKFALVALVNWLLYRINKLEASQAWRPMSEAKRDGTVIASFIRGNGVSQYALVSFSFDNHWNDDGEGHSSWNEKDLEGWYPLPAIPKEHP